MALSLTRYQFTDKPSWIAAFLSLGLCVEMDAYDQVLRIGKSNFAAL